MFSRLAVGVSTPLAAARRCHGCRRPEGMDVIAWASGRWAFVTNPGAVYVFEPWGEPCTDKEAAKQLDDANYRTLIPALTEGGLCPRCAHTFPTRPRRRRW